MFIEAYGMAPGLRTSLLIYEILTKLHKVWAVVITTLQERGHCGTWRAMTCSVAESQLNAGSLSPEPVQPLLHEGRIWGSGSGSTKGARTANEKGPQLTVHKTQGQVVHLDILLPLRKST